MTLMESPSIPLCPDVVWGSEVSHLARARVIVSKRLVEHSAV